MLTVIPAKATVIEKNKLENVKSFSFVQSDNLVVIPFDAVLITAQDFTNYKLVSFSKNSNNIFVTIDDVGWKSYTTNYIKNIKEIVIKYSDIGIQKQDSDIGCWWCNACRNCGTLPPPPPPPVTE